MSLAQNRPLLEDFVAGRLSARETAQVLAELADDDEALAVVDALWAERPAGSLELPTPDLTPEQARQIERGLFRRLHRSDFGGKAIMLATEGFFGVLLAMLRPLMMAGRPGRRGARPKGTEQ